MSVVRDVSPYDTYRQATENVPETVLAWNVYGTGIESVGREGRPESVGVPSIRPDQILLRIDAVGLCFSDVKLIRLGGDHPKLYGRDLEHDPTRLGHEVSATIMAVGDTLTDRFRPGQRLAIQPDIYVDGRSTAYGYTIPGGLIEYHAIGPEVLAADDGAYVVPVDDRMGYAETALTEPWACVEAAYTQRRRLRPLTGGRMLVLARPEDDRPYRFGSVLAGASELVVAGASDALAAIIRSAAPGAASKTAASIDEALALGPFDDIVMLGRIRPATSRGPPTRWPSAGPSTWFQTHCSMHPSTSTSGGSTTTTPRMSARTGSTWKPPMGKNATAPSSGRVV